MRIESGPAVTSAHTSIRHPFFPPEDYAHIHPRLADEIAAQPSPPVGHMSPQIAEFLYSLVRLIRPSFVVETGLNVGHSALVVLLAQESVGLRPQVMSVDICQYEETRLAAERIKQRHSGFTFVEGDSRAVLQKAVNKHLRAHEDLTLGLGMIDGGHEAETAQHDLNVLLSFLRLGGFLWLDDFEKEIPNSGVNIAGRQFANTWGSCIRFRAPGNRGVMLHQKAF